MAGNRSKKENFTPDRLIHEPVRLQIISYLAAGAKQATFTELKEKLGLTAGNLSVQLKRLAEADYVYITKSIRERKPLTRVFLTHQGMVALRLYLNEMEAMVEQLKRSTAQAQEGEEIKTGDS